MLPEVSPPRQRRRPRRLRAKRPLLTIEQILAWADAHFQRTGQWPTTERGPIPEAPGETWANVNAAMQQGRRGFHKGDSLPRLLAENRGVRNLKGLPSLSFAEVLAWADAFCAEK